MWLTEWLRAGQDYRLFWDLTPREIHLALKAHHARQTAEHDRERARLHEAAQLVGWAFHDPKKMPEFKATVPTKKREVSTAADEAMVRAYFIGLSMRKH